jgi:hypothetical protein
LGAQTAPLHPLNAADAAQFLIKKTPVVFDIVQLQH